MKRKKAVKSRMKKFDNETEEKNEQEFSCFDSALNIYTIFRYLWDDTQTFEKQIKLFLLRDHHTSNLERNNNLAK